MEMEIGNEGSVLETDVGLECLVQKTSKLAIASLVFGIMGPFLAGTMWIGSFYDAFTGAVTFIMIPFVGGITWMLGLIFGKKAIERIRSSEGRLVGKEYAIAGALISALWVFVIFVGLLLPGIYSVNS